MYEVKKYHMGATTTGAFTEDYVERLFPTLERAIKYIEADAPVDIEPIIAKGRVHMTYIYNSVNVPLVGSEDDPSCTITSYTITKQANLFD